MSAFWNSSIIKTYFSLGKNKQSAVISFIILYVWEIVAIK